MVPLTRFTNTGKTLNKQKRDDKFIKINIMVTETAMLKYHDENGFFAPFICASDMKMGQY